MSITLFPWSFQEDTVLFVNKETHEVALFENGTETFRAPAAIGKTDDLTPEGTFNIQVKAKDPYYRKKDIPGGVPENPLGSRWIGFDARDTDGRIYGVHGTNQPESIGKSVSAGCIRLTNEKVEQLYDLIPKGAEVVIVKSGESMDKLYEQWDKQKWKLHLT
ncbi:L,D-transpeptidase [Halobacillus locisalis]|uniref:L,D-transpeptidase n=1 Tax=Halobacillus locisalis TaxID=220753 RepID=A0A838CNS8_9BACI|nr:L,D-transpeptidase [Halobacillus locisalis]MBA2173670.1 L,D-transpeptidase [Halobacillus locisalis]